MSRYNAVVYRGRAVAFTIQEHKTRRSIELLKDIPHVFDHNLTSEEVNYYNKLRSIGVELLYTHVSKPKKRDTAKRVKERATKRRDVPDVDEEVEKQFHELEVPEVEVVKSTTDDKSSSVKDTVEKVDIKVEEGFEAELSEYLDMNYSEEEVHELAKELELSGIRSNFRKGTVIDRLVTQAYDEIYKLVFM